MGAESELKKAAMEYYVFSRTLKPGRRNYVTFVNEPLAPFVEALRAKSGKNIWHAGGGELAREFLKTDLIDELYLGVVPTLIGEGIPLFPPKFPQREFELTETKTYDGGLLAPTLENARHDPAEALHAIASSMTDGTNGAKIASSCIRAGWA
jgi:dihydrofolate reductase